MIDMERAMQFDTPEFEIRKINGSLDILETRIKELESRVAELEKQIEITDERRPFVIGGKSSWLY